jgi:hypothetical protein
MAKSPRTGDEGGVFYPIFRLPNEPQLRGTRPMDPLLTLSHGFEPYQQCRYPYPYHE